MIRNFDYKDITLNDIENNKHLIFICDGDKVGVLVEKEWSMDREKLLEVINHYGVQHQLKKLVEEVYELVEAILTDIGTEESLDHIKEEHSDVSLVLNEIKEYYEIGYMEDMLPRMNYKLDRTLKRKEEEK